MPTVKVKSRIVGSLESEVMLSDVVLDIWNEQLTVAELIALTVEEQINDLLINRKLDAEKTSQVLKRQYLTNEDIRQQAESGTIRLSALKQPHALTINTHSEVRSALEAFQKRTCVIVVDGYQPERLDETITLQATSKVTFIRLTPLVGG